MSQDVVSDALNMMRNAIKARKETLEIKRISGLLIEVLKIMKQKNAIKRYKIDSRKKTVEIDIGTMVECRAIKPRFTVKKEDIEKYRRRFLPARGIGTIVVSTNKGLITHDEAVEKGTGGSLIAYFY
ncbi:MAG: 30S ribosomal protein S8 [Candidatus Pacearchaeota archaeon]|jgi:small subunit ribosomal protein S8